MRGPAKLPALDDFRAIAHLDREEQQRRDMLRTKLDGGDPPKPKRKPSPRQVSVLELLFDAE